MRSSSISRQTSVRYQQVSPAPWGQIYATLSWGYRDETKRVLCAAFGESLRGGGRAMKRLIVVVVGLLGAIVAGGAGWSF